MLLLYKNILSDDNEKPFLYYYLINEGKDVKIEKFTRKEFFSLILKAAWLIKKSGARKNDKILHCFSRNDYVDCVFRHASTLTGTVPVTVNWQADTPDKVLFKYENSKVVSVLIGEGCNTEFVEIIRRNCPSAKFIYFD